MTLLAAQIKALTCFFQQLIDSADLFTPWNAKTIAVIRGIQICLEDTRFTPLVFLEAMVEYTRRSTKADIEEEDGMFAQMVGWTISRGYLELLQ